MDVKMNLRIVTKNHAADPEIVFLTKSISKPNGHATAMPTAWKLKKFCLQASLWDQLSNTSKISKIIRRNKELHVKFEGNVSFEVTRGHKMQKTVKPSEIGISSWASDRLKTWKKELSLQLI